MYSTDWLNSLRERHKTVRRRKWQPTPVFFPGESHGQRRLAAYSPWGHKESDTTDWLIHTHTHETVWWAQLMMVGLSQSDGSKGILEILPSTPSFHTCKTWEPEQLSSWFKIMFISADPWWQDWNPGVSFLVGLLSIPLGTLFLGMSLILQNMLGLITSLSQEQAGLEQWKAAHHLSQHICICNLLKLKQNKTCHK